jgi:hypothetical protein
VTVPPGLDGEPGAVSVTVAVQDAVSNAGTGDGVQLTDVEVGRLLTDVVTDALLLPGVSDTPAGAVVVAVFVIELEVDDETVAVTVNVAVPPESRFTAEVEMLPEPEAGQDEPAEAEQVQLTPVSPDGRLSVTVAPTTSEGPLFFTTMVYEIVFR